MLRFIVKQQLEYDDDPVYYCEIAGNSNDNKPTLEIATGSSFVESDTGDCYLFDEETSGWHKVGGDDD